VDVKKDPVRAQAKVAGDIKYIGNPCSVCSGVHRYTKNGGCVRCNIKHTMAWAKRNPVKTDAINARTRVKNAERRRMAVWVCNKMPTPTRVRPNSCEICAGVNKNGKVLSLDHCHKSNIFRGWLCNKCNTGLGKLGDSVHSLERALAYLRLAYGN